jgi:hypothetical protein
MDTQIPQWLAPVETRGRLVQAPQPPVQLPAQLDTRTHLDLTYEAMFETTLDYVQMGRPLSHIVRDDPRDINYAHYLNWIHKDPIRKQRYYTAQEIGAESVADELMHIADATDSLEDVARSTLRINTRKWLLGVWNRKRFGETKQLEVNNTTTINIRDELANREKQLMNVFEGEFARE